jgi:hypothetical protein
MEATLATPCSSAQEDIPRVLLQYHSSITSVLPWYYLDITENWMQEASPMLPLLQAATSPEYYLSFVQVSTKCRNPGYRPG